MMRALLIVAVAQAQVALADMPEVQGSSLLSSKTSVQPQSRHGAEDIDMHEETVRRHQVNMVDAAEMEIQNAKSEMQELGVKIGQQHELERLRSELQTPDSDVTAAPEETDAEPDSDRHGWVGDTPEDLAKLAETMGNSQIAQNAASLEMSATRNAEAKLDATQATNSEAAAVAEHAHIVAADQYLLSEKLHNTAAQARDEADAAVAAMNEAQKRLDEKRKEEHTARMSHLEKQRIEKQARVVFETADMKSRALKDAHVTQKSQQSSARENVEDKEEAVYQGNKNKAEATEAWERAKAKLAEMTNIQSDKKSEQKNAMAEANSATAEHEKAAKELASLKAKKAKIEEEEKASMENEGLAHEAFHAQVEITHKIDVQATEAEARAKAAAKTANDHQAATLAKKDKVAAMP